MAARNSSCNSTPLVREEEVYLTEHRYRIISLHAMVQGSANPIDIMFIFLPRWTGEKDFKTEGRLGLFGPSVQDSRGKSNGDLCHGNTVDHRDDSLAGAGRTSHQILCRIVSAILAIDAVH